MINPKEENQFERPNREQLDSPDPLEVKAPFLQKEPIFKEPIIVQDKGIKPQYNLNRNYDRSGKQVFYLVESPDQSYVKTLEQVLTIELLPTQELITQHKFFIDMMNLQNDKLQLSYKELNLELISIKAENQRLNEQNLNFVKLQISNKELNDVIKQIKKDDSLILLQTQDKYVHQKAKSKLMQEKIKNLESSNQKLQNQNKELNEIINQLQLQDRHILEESSEKQISLDDSIKIMNDKMNKLLSENSSLKEKILNYQQLDVKNQILNEQLDILSEKNLFIQSVKSSIDENQDLNQQMIVMIKQFHTQQSSEQWKVQDLSQESQGDIVVRKVILVEKQKNTLEELEKNSAVKISYQNQLKDKELIELQIILQNRVKKVVELEGKIDVMKDDQRNIQGLFTPDNQNFYKDLLFQRDQFDKLSVLYQEAISSQQQITSHKQISKEKIDQKNQRICKLELQNLDLRRVQQGNVGLQTLDVKDNKDSDDQFEEDDKNSDDEHEKVQLKQKDDKQSDNQLEKDNKQSDDNVEIQVQDCLLQGNKHDKSDDLSKSSLAHHNDPNVTEQLISTTLSQLDQEPK